MFTYKDLPMEKQSLTDVSDDSRVILYCDMKTTAICNKAEYMTYI